MQKIGANDGDRWREGNLAAGTEPKRLGPRQRQQGGEQIKKRGRDREREIKAERHKGLEGNQTKLSGSLYSLSLQSESNNMLTSVRKQS